MLVSVKMKVIYDIFYRSFLPFLDEKETFLYTKTILNSEFILFFLLIIEKLELLLLFSLKRELIIWINFSRNWPSKKNIEGKRQQKKTDQTDGIELATKEFTYVSIYVSIFTVILRQQELFWALSISSFFF